MQNGWNIEDSIYLCKELEKVGADRIHVSSGGNIENRCRLVIETAKEIKNRVLVAKSADTEFDTVGKTGGAKTHTHTLSSAGYAAIFGSLDGYIAMRRVSTTSSYNSTHKATVTVAATNVGAFPLGTELGGSTDSGSSLQPYIVVYRYRRVS